MTIPSSLAQRLTIKDPSTITFRTLVEQLMGEDSYILVGNQIKVRLVELEMYWKGPGHNDPFTHAHEEQGRLGLFYFHRVGAQKGESDGYRGGNFKGCDIALGCEGARAGLLIRAVEIMNEKHEIVEGPSKFMDFVLDTIGYDSVEALVKEGWKGNMPWCGGMENAPMELVMGDAVAALVPTMRVGLTLRTKGGVDYSESERFVGRRYRYVRQGVVLKRRKHLVVVAGLEDGYDVDIVAKWAGAGLKTCQRWQQHWEEGRELMDLKSFREKVCGVGDSCRLAGAISKLGYS